MQPERKADAIDSIVAELNAWVPELESQGRMVEAQRIHQRTRYDLEMIKSMGYCHGIENYSRHFSGRCRVRRRPTAAGLFSARFFCSLWREPRDDSAGAWDVVRGTAAGKQNLVDYGFRLPSANGQPAAEVEEFENRVQQAIYVSATPGPYELTKISRSCGGAGHPPHRTGGPGGGNSPPSRQIDDLLGRFAIRAKRNERVLVTTLTKRMAEDLAGYYTEVDVRCRYLHSEIETLKSQAAAGLRRGEFGRADRH